MSMGDKVEIIVAVGETVITRSIEADKQGRQITIDEPTKTSALWDIKLLTRGGTVLQKHSFAADRVVAIIDERKGGGEDG